MSDIITQVSPEAYNGVRTDDSVSNIDYNSNIHLNIRGTKFTITRDELMSLPESILLCLFPNGVFLDEHGQVISNLTEEDIVFVNFEPGCFQYITKTFSDAERDLQNMPLSPQLSGSYGRSPENVLHNKPAIIVLREDLDFYVVPQSPGLNAEQMRYLKLRVGERLMDCKQVFTGLGYDPENPASEHSLGPAEHHLFDMLCTSGFHHNGSWGSRSMEPSKCVILSLLLVRLKNEEASAPDSPALDPVASNTSITSRSRSRIASLANSASRVSRSLSRQRKSDSNQTKLLLFWRKPARKCWWSNQEMDFEVDQSIIKTLDNIVKTKVHIRRVWTLELSVVGAQ